MVSSLIKTGKLQERVQYVYIVYTSIFQGKLNLKSLSCQHIMHARSSHIHTVVENRWIKIKLYLSFYHQCSLDIFRGYRKYWSLLSFIKSYRDNIFILQIQDHYQIVLHSL